MAIWGMLAISVALGVANYFLNKALAPRVALPEPGELDVPIVDEGRPIPVVFGTVKLAPHIVGVWGKEVIQDSAGNNVFRAQIHGVLCHGPVDAVRDVQFGDISLHFIVPGPGDRIASGLTDIMSPLLPWARETVPSFPADPFLLWRHLGLISALTAYSRSRPPNRDVSVYGGSGADGGFSGPLDFYWGIHDDPTLLPVPAIVEPAPLLVDSLGADYAPSYPGICHMTFGLPDDAPLGGTLLGVPPRFIWSKNNPYLLPVTFVVTRQPMHLLPDCEGDFNASDANPIQAIYEILTDRHWGLGFEPSLLQYSHWARAAQTCHDEGLGVSFALTERVDASDVIEDIGRHANATVFTDPRTGLLSVHLVRPVADASVLPLFTEAEVDEIQVTRTQWQDTINEVWVRYRQYVEREPSDTDEGFLGVLSAAAQGQNPAHAMQVGEVRSEVVEYSMYSSPVLAKAKADELAVIRSALRISGSGYFNRTAFGLFPGSAFRVAFPSHEVPERVVRVASIDYGSDGDGRIFIEWVEDVMSEVVSWSSAPPTPVPGGPGGPPGSPPDAAVGGNTALIRSNAVMRARFMDGVGASYYEPNPETDDAVIRHALLVDRGDARNQTYGMQVQTPDTASLFVDVEDNPLGTLFGATLIGALAQSYSFASEGSDETGFRVTWLSGHESASFPLSASQDDRNRGGQVVGGARSANLLGWIGGTLRQPNISPAEDTRQVLEQPECIAYREIVANGDGTHQVRGVFRAVLDSVPPATAGAVWPAGTLVRLPWWYGPLPVRQRASQPTDYVDGADLQVQVTPSTFLTGVTSVPFDLRDPYGVPHHLAPYPVARVRVNGFSLVDWPSTVTGDLAVSWARRHRVDQGTDFVVPWSDGDWGGALEGAYRIEVLIDGVVVGARTVASTTAQTFDYTNADRLTDDSDLSKPTQIRITPINAAIQVTAAYGPYGTGPALGDLEGAAWLSPPIYHSS